MQKKTQKLSIRLLKSGLDPSDSLRGDLTLKEWDRIEGARIALDTLSGGHPKWSRFLDLSAEERGKLRNRSGLGIVFVNTLGHWLAVSFGLAHVRLDPSKFVHNFGLRVTLNTVHPEKLKSTDIRTPNENALLRRSQTSRGVSQAAFDIDNERDIIKGVAGIPKDPNFASRVAGSDSLVISKKMDIDDLVAVCTDCLKAYKLEDYKEKFSWIDNIKHVRDKEVIEKLDTKMINIISEIVKTGNVGEADVHLAYPTVYDPESTHHLKYMGFKRTKEHQPFPDLTFQDYVDDLRNQDISNYTHESLKNHRAHEVDEDGNDCGGRWKISECLFLEVQDENSEYIRSDGNWYQIDTKFSKQLSMFLTGVFGKANLPNAKYEEWERDYNIRVGSTSDKLCLDRKLVASSDGGRIELCDLLDKNGNLFHVKRGTASSALSHLFNQGANSAQVLTYDMGFRDNAIQVISAEEGQCGKSGFSSQIAPSNQLHQPSKYRIVFAVISKSDNPKLPFFSQISLRRAVNDIERFGYSVEFCWVGVDPST